MNKQYHLMFNNFEQEEVLAVREIIKAGLFRASTEDRMRMLNALNERLCKIHNLIPLPLVLEPEFSNIGQMTGEKIILNKPSLVSFLHEFYHLMTYHTAQNSEINARGWSISLYYKATPKLCKAAIEKGLIIHQTTIQEEN